MTLILNCLTQEYLFQVSDRRLVSLPTYKVEDDNANKSIYFAGRISFGYTGLAEIEGKKTDHWLLDILPSPPDESNFISVIKERAETAFKKSGLPKNFQHYKRHAFVGIGWMKSPYDGTLCCPSMVLISNCINSKGQFVSLTDTFDVFISHLPSNEKLRIIPVGQDIPRVVLKTIKKKIGRYITQKESPREILKLLVVAMREVAKRNQMVGKNLLAVGMPKSAVGNASLVTPLKGISDYVEDLNTFMYFPTVRKVEFIPLTSSAEGLQSLIRSIRLTATILSISLLLDLVIAWAKLASLMNKIKRRSVSALLLTVFHRKITKP